MTRPRPWTGLEQRRTRRDPEGPVYPGGLGGCPSRRHRGLWDGRVPDRCRRRREPPDHQDERDGHGGRRFSLDAFRRGFPLQLIRCIPAADEKYRTPPPPSDGVLLAERVAHRPVRLVGDSTVAVECRRVVPSPQVRDVMYSLLGGRLDREDRREETEDEHHRERDHEPDPCCGEGDLAHRCVHAGETSHRRFVFRGFEGVDFDFRPGEGQDPLVRIEQVFYTDLPPVNRLPDRSDPWHLSHTPSSTATPTSRSSMAPRHRTTWSSGPRRSA